MINSFTCLGSDEVIAQVITDIKFLFETAETEKFTPVLLSMGIKVVEIGLVHKVKKKFKINSWPSFLNKNYSKFLEQFNKETKEFYTKCDNNMGIFDVDTYKVPVLFNPDEDYLSLHVRVDDDPKSKDSELYLITFKPDEILVDFNYINN